MAIVVLSIAEVLTAKGTKRLTNLTIDYRLVTEARHKGRDTFKLISRIVLIYPNHFKKLNIFIFNCQIGTICQVFFVAKTWFFVESNTSDLHNKRKTITILGNLPPEIDMEVNRLSFQVLFWSKQ